MKLISQYITSTAIWILWLLALHKDTIYDVHGFVKSLSTTSFSCNRLLPNHNEQRRHVIALHETSVPIQEGGSSKMQFVQQQPDMEAYAKGYKTVFNELPFQRCQPIIGKVPDDLIGSYFRSGPAMFSAGSIVPPKKSIVQPKKPPVPDGVDMDRMVKHPFEGDGAVLGITFAPSSTTTTEEGNDSRNAGIEVSARYRFIRTIGFTAERKKGAHTYKGMDTTRVAAGASIGNDFPIPFFRHHLQPGLNKYRKNTSNTRAFYWSKRLFSLWEGGQPYKLDGRALDTEGKSRLGGAIKKEEDPFGGKIVYDPVRQHVLFYGVTHGAKSSTITLYEFDSTFKLISPTSGRQDFDIPGFALINDFIATQNYAIFIQPDVTIKNSMEYMVSKDPGKVLNVGAGPGTIHLLPRGSASNNNNIKYKSIKIPVDDVSEANIHFCNAYEDESKNIIIDVIRSKGNTSNKPLTTWPWVDTLQKYQTIASKKSFWRYIVDTKTGSVKQKQLLSNDQCDFGIINPQYSTQKHQYIYMNIGANGPDIAPPQGILKFDMITLKQDKWMPEPYEYCGEPMYAPKTMQGNDALEQEEDSGYILSILFDGRKEESSVLIFHANNISAGPITRIPLGMAIPHGYFGCFAPDAIWTADEIERRAKLSDKIESKGNMWNEVKSDFAGLGLRLDDMEEYFGDFFI